MCVKALAHTFYYIAFGGAQWKSELSPANQMWFGISINYYYQELWAFYWCQIVRSKSHVNITLLFIYFAKHLYDVNGNYLWRSVLSTWQNETLPTQIHENSRLFRTKGCIRRNTFTAMYDLNAVLRLLKGYYQIAHSNSHLAHIWPHNSSNFSLAKNLISFHHN